MSLQHKFVTALGANDLEQARQGTTGPRGKGPGIHQHQPFDTRRMAHSKTESDWAAPIMQYQRNIAYVQVQHQGFEISDMMLQAIRIWGRRYTGFPHAHMIRYNATSMLRQRWDELPIQIAPGWIPVYEDNGFALTIVNIVELHSLVDVIVWGKGPGTCPRLVFELDHTGLRCCGTLTADTPDGDTHHFSRRFCRAI